MNNVEGRLMMTVRDIRQIMADWKVRRPPRPAVPDSAFHFPVRKPEPFLLENPGVQYSFLTKAIHDLRAAQRQIITIGRFAIPKRLAIFLLDCSGHDNYFDRNQMVLTLPMTRYGIADYLSTSVETITRAFAELERQGLVHRLTARTLRIRLARNGRASCG